MHAHALVLSFHPTKCLTTGEGGMMIARDPSMLARARTLRDGGGTGGRMFSPLSDLAAALGLSQLSRYRSFLDRRRQIGARYLAALSDAPALLRPAGHLADGMFYRFPLRLPGGLERWSGFFASRGIAARRGVDELLHRTLELPDDAFPQASQAFESTVCVPLHPSMSADEVDRCVAALRALNAMTQDAH
jgi:dTDP-4-amino-4,6-dideoxygalactose transaminase